MSQGGLFATLFSPVRTDQRDCDEDQLTAALAVCCRFVPGLGSHLAHELFQVELADRGTEAEIQCTHDPTVRYDLVLGAGYCPTHRNGGLVIENKIESGFGVSLIPEGESKHAAAHELGPHESQVHKYLRISSRWVHAPRVAAIVKYAQDVPTVNDPRWAGCVTWTDLDSALKRFDTTASQPAAFLVAELSSFLRHVGAVMEPVPPNVFEPMNGWSHLAQLLTASVSSLGRRRRGPPHWRDDGFYLYIVPGRGSYDAVLSFRTGMGVYLCVRAADMAGKALTRILENAGFVPDNHPAFEGGWGWYREPQPLPLDFETHRSWPDQLSHTTGVLREALRVLPDFTAGPEGG